MASRAASAAAQLGRQRRPSLRSVATAAAPASTTDARVSSAATLQRRAGASTAAQSYALETHSTTRSMAGASRPSTGRPCVVATAAAAGGTSALRTDSWIAPTHHRHSHHQYAPLRAVSTVVKAAPRGNSNAKKAATPSPTPEQAMDSSATDTDATMRRYAKRQAENDPRQPGRAQVDDVVETIERLASTFSAYFPRRLSKPRTIGREAEFPVVRADGSAGDVQAVLDQLDEEGNMRIKLAGDVGLFNDDYEYSLEVGKGTLEIIVGPCDDLHQLKEVHERAVQRAARAAAKVGQRLVGLGCQPVTPPSRALVSPKWKYEVLLKAMADPKHWELFTVTASDQVHVDVAQPELLRAINVGNLMSPLIVALCGNSPFIGGEPTGFVTSREGKGAEIYASQMRHGMPRGPFYGMAQYIEHVVDQEYLLRPRTAQERWRRYKHLQPVTAPGEPTITFADHLSVAGFDWEGFQVHDHYVWNSARPRTEQRTIEFRCADQQPWDSHMAVPALMLGLTEASHAILRDNELRDALDWRLQRRFHGAALTSGLRAKVASLDVSQFVHEVLTLSKEALQRRGHGEEDFLEPMFERLARRENPGQAALRMQREHGLAAVIDARAVPLVAGV